jgi:hypothetical protein
MVAGEQYVTNEAFVWIFGSARLTLRQEGESWNLICCTESPLLGPALIAYEAHHRQPKLAAWDVLARVTRFTRDDEEGVRVAMAAARWMCSLQ